jgi:hypothetical protein
VTKDQWLAAVAVQVPEKHQLVNGQAFLAGYELGAATAAA